MSVNLFGTDGIRGKVNLVTADEEEAIYRLIEHRDFSSVLRLIGESLGVLPNLVSKKPQW